MYFKSKKTTLLILGVTALVCSRTMFLSFNDSEGPNLLVVMVMATFIFGLSLATYLYKLTSLDKSRVFLSLAHVGLVRLLLVIFIQVVLAIVIYFLLG